MGANEGGVYRPVPVLRRPALPQPNRGMSLVPAGRRCRTPGPGSFSFGLIRPSVGALLPRSVLMDTMIGRGAPCPYDDPVRILLQGSGATDPADSRSPGASGEDCWRYIRAHC